MVRFWEHGPVNTNTSYLNWKEMVFDYYFHLYCYPFYSFEKICDHGKKSSKGFTNCQPMNRSLCWAASKRFLVRLTFLFANQLICNCSSNLKQLVLGSKMKLWPVTWLSPSNKFNFYIIELYRSIFPLNSTTYVSIRQPFLRLSPSFSCILKTS